LLDSKRPVLSRAAGLATVRFVANRIEPSRASGTAVAVVLTVSIASRSGSRRQRFWCCRTSSASSGAIGELEGRLNARFDDANRHVDAVDQRFDKASENGQAPAPLARLDHVFGCPQPFFC
jgi:hypothetical protein